MKNNNISNLKIMIKKFKPNGIDWMNFVLTRKNPFTFHHIISRSIGGEDSIENGAILTRKAHDLIHILEYACPDAYNDLQEIFTEINSSNTNPKYEILNKIDDILYNVFNHEKYEFLVEVDLSNFENIYYNHEKKVIKMVRK